MFYTEIDSAAQIRILQVRSLSSTIETASTQLDGHVPIHCELFPVKRSDNPSYEALSYCWGDAADRLPIQVNGEQVAVTRNLWLALEHLRDEFSDVLLWVDALCINQENIPEKNEQMKKMAEVYSNSSRTLAWVGLAVENSEAFVSRITRFATTLIDRGGYGIMMKLATAPAGSGDAQVAGKAALDLISDEINIALSDHESTARFLADLRDFRSREYWERVWIMQEIVLTPKVTIFCGKSSLEFEHLQIALAFLPLLQTNLTAEMLKLMYVSEDESEFDRLSVWFDAFGAQEYPGAASEIAGLWRKYQKPFGTEARHKLVEILVKVHMNRKTKATDPRDRIFGLLGMATDIKSLSIVPKYETSYSCATAYSDAARAIMSSGILDLLSYAQPNKAGYEIPSWVPDWRGDIVEPCGQHPWNSFFNVSNGMNFRQHPNFERTSPEQLILYGFRIDVIEQLRPQCNSGAPWALDSPEQATYLKDINDLCELSNSKLKSTGIEIYPEPSDRLVAHTRTPIANQELNSSGFVMQATDHSDREYGDALARTVYSSRKTNPNAKRDLFDSYVPMMQRQFSRRPFISTKGFVGLAPGDAREGDLIVGFLGAKFPYALRSNGHGTYALVGDMYVHGIMNGIRAKEEADVAEFVLQ